jgi:hypothetical protein
MVESKDSKEILDVANKLLGEYVSKSLEGTIIKPNQEFNKLQFEMDGPYEQMVIP